MASKMSFGTILRETREKKRLDLTMVARRLRIRPDILEAIEDADFTRMPPRGYTRNMVNAYAHFLGLNATDVTRMYLDECYAYQVGNARQKTRGRDFDMNAGRKGSIPQGQLRDNGSGRRRYSDGYRTEETSRMQRMRDEQSRTHRTSRRAVEDVQYMNFYSGPKASQVKPASKLPFIIASIIILVLVIIVCVLLFGPKGSSSQSGQEVMPVTGVEETGSTSEQSTTQQTEEEQAPESMTLEYEVPEGSTAYLEIYVDGTAEVMDTISGPETGSLESSGTIEIIYSPYSGEATFTLDGEALELTDDDGNGVYTMTIDFEDVLAAWNEEHGTSGTDGSSSSNSSDATDSANSSNSSSSANSSTGSSTSA